MEELSSDVFVALWQSAEGLREDSDLKLWLGVVARNQGLKHLRSLRLSLPLEEAILPGEDEGPSSLWERREDAQQVREAVLGLEAVDRDIFLRHYYWRQTVARIAEELGMDLEIVKTEWDGLAPALLSGKIDCIIAGMSPPPSAWPPSTSPTLL